MVTPTTFAAREAAIRRHYHQPRRSTFLSSPVPVVASTIAVVGPTTYTVEPPHPHSGLDPHPSHGLVPAGTGAVLVLVVFIVLAGKVLVRVIRVADGAVLY